MTHWRGIGFLLLGLAGLVIVLLLYRADPLGRRSSRGETAPPSNEASAEERAHAPTKDTTSAANATGNVEATAESQKPAWTLIVEPVDEHGAGIAAACHFFDAAGKTIAFGTARKGEHARLFVQGTGSLVVFSFWRPVPLAPALVKDLSPPESGTERVVRVQLDVGLSITGQVLAWDRRTPARGRVTAVPVDPPLPSEELSLSQRQQTDRDGRFELRGLFPGRYRLEVRPGRTAAGEAPRTAPEFEAGAQGVQIVLSSLVPLSFRFIDTKTKLTIDRSYRLWEVTGQGDKIFGTSGSNVRGRPGTVRRFRAEIDGYKPSLVVDFQIGRDRLRRQVDIPLEPDPRPTTTVELRLRDDTGAPVEGEMLVMRVWGEGSARGRSYKAEGGLVRFVLPPGPHRLRIERNRRARGPLSVPLLPKSIELELDGEDQRLVAVTLDRGSWLLVRANNALLQGGPSLRVGAKKTDEAGDEIFHDADFALVDHDSWIALLEPRACTVLVKYNDGWLEENLDLLRGEKHLVDLRPPKKAGD